MKKIKEVKEDKKYIITLKDGLVECFILSEGYIKMRVFGEVDKKTGYLIVDTPVKLRPLPKLIKK